MAKAKATATAPQATAPQATAPQATAPQATAPQATAPQATAPQATAPITLDAALLSIRPQLDAIGQSISAAQSALVQAYKDLVALIDGHEHRAAFVDAESGKLARGVLDSIVKLCPAIDKSTFSSAWGAFSRNPDAFNACKAIRQFRDVQAPAVDAEQEQQSTAPNVDIAKVIKQFASAVDKALSSGVSVVLLAETLRSAARKAVPAAPAAEVTTAAA